MKPRLDNSCDIESEPVIGYGSIIGDILKDIQDGMFLDDLIKRYPELYFEYITSEKTPKGYDIYKKRKNKWLVAKWRII